MKTSRKGHDFKVLVNYKRNGVAVAQSIYTGPHRKHAEFAFQQAGALGSHGILGDCTVTFFDGYRIRQDLTKTFDQTPLAAALNEALGWLDCATVRTAVRLEAELHPEHFGRLERRLEESIIKIRKALHDA